MLRIGSPLPDSLEALLERTIGCCIAVHRELGAGLPEHAYAKALSLELTVAGIPLEREKRYPLHYRNQFLCDVYLDFVIADSLVVEIKAVEHLAEIHHSQTLNYMRVSRLRAGLLINFSVPVLKAGIRRKILRKETSCVFVSFVLFVVPARRYSARSSAFTRLPYAHSPHGLPCRHEDTKTRRHEGEITDMLRLPSPLDEDLETLIHRVIGCCIEVHRHLGPGLLEVIYQRAVAYERQETDIRCEREKRYPVTYRGHNLYVHCLDIVVEDRLILELKAVELLHPVHTAQTISSLRAFKLPVALLFNFNVAVLAQGIKRIVL
jgi:GxxExxY protein